MQFEEDFINESLVEFEIEGRKFKYKPATAGDELEWADEYIEIVNGKSRQNLKKITECKIRNIKEVPYTQEVINKIIGINKEWNDLKKEEKLKVFRKLDPRIFDKIIKKINEIDSPNDEVKKN